MPARAPTGPAVNLELTDKVRELTKEIVEISRGLYDELFGSALSAAESRQVAAMLKKVRALGFRLPKTDFKLRRAQQYPIWKD